MRKRISSYLSANDGEWLPSKPMFDTTGKRQMKSEQAQMIRHIIFTNPGIKNLKFPELNTAFFVLIAGRAEKRFQAPKL